MITNIDDKNKQIISFFNNFLGWHKARVTFLVLFIEGLLKVQTVNFNKIATSLNGSVNINSNLRRIQRFFADFLIDSEVIARLIFYLLPNKPPYRLCLDRTNWKFGITDINILMLSVTYKGIAIPILWTMLPKKGNSNSNERKELMHKYLKLFGISSIESLLADREFIGDEWFEDLIENNIPFYIRIRNNSWINLPRSSNRNVKASWLFNNLPMNTVYHYPKIVNINGRWLYLSGIKTLNKENKIDIVVIASYKYDVLSLKIYKDRWQIETMFKAFKSNGFNLEDTHLSDLERISKMLSLVCIAYVWAYKMGIYRHEKIKEIIIKKHGRKQYSFFKYGLIFLANAFLSIVIQDIDTAINVLSCT